MYTYCMDYNQTQMNKLDIVCIISLILNDNVLYQTPLILSKYTYCEDYNQTQEGYCVYVLYHANLHDNLFY